MIDVRLLGQVAVAVDGVTLSGEAAQRRRIALLALLCVPPLRPISRDRLMLYLWPENGSESARHLLSVAVHALRKSLGHDALVAGLDEIAVNGSCFRVDVVDFAAALGRGEDEQAVALYGGPFMDGFHAGSLPEFERWLDAERAGVDRSYAETLERAASARTAAGEHGRALEAWQRLALLDPYSSHAALGLMKALAKSGNRAAAIRHAAVHRQMLNVELDAGPDPEVETLAEALRQEGEPPPAARMSAPSGDGARPAGQPEPGRGHPGRDAQPSVVPTATAPMHDTSPERIAEAEVQARAPEQPSEPAMLPVSGTRTSPRTRIWTTAAVAIGVVGVLGGAVAILQNVWDRLELAPFAGAAPMSIAVLPFENLTPHVGGDDVGDVIAQRILDELYYVEGLKLVSFRSSRSVRGRNLNTREIGRLLAANWTVGGTFRVTADSVHFSVEMASTRDGFLVWDRQYDRPRRAILDVQKDVAREVATSLGHLQAIGPPARTTPATAGGGQRAGSAATVTRSK